MMTLFRDDFQPRKTRNQFGESFWLNPKLNPYLTAGQEEVNQKLKNLNDVSDVSNLLELPTGQLTYILYNKKPAYKTFGIKKKSGKVRIIDSPNNSILILQNKIKPVIESYYRVKKTVHGFVSGRSIISNAEQHKKSKYILNLDLKDFFHAVNFGRVKGIFKSTPFNFGDKAATVLAQLCTYQGRLPQGAPTSPLLSNLAATSLDRELVHLAKRFHMTYTRYADDITFSSNKKFDEQIVTFLIEKECFEVGVLLRKKIEESGFEISESKTRVSHRSQRQEVTGLTVNDKVNVPRKYIRETRAMLHSWGLGLLEAERKYLSLKKGWTSEKLNSTKLDGSYFKRAIYGRLGFIKSIQGEDSSPYLSLCKKAITLDSNPPKFIQVAKEKLDMYDVFICHASEDKEAIVFPLEKALVAKGVKVFVDSSVIKWGDSLVDKINHGLRVSKFVIAVLSPASVNKAWPKKEINAIMSMEIKTEKKKLLPLLAGSDDLINEFPLMSDKLYKKFDNNVDEIVDGLCEMLQET
ncbi:TIR domain-containing anti-phage reverse transcriptase [Aeromonas veronii]|uniref:TIR domain-containing anti-phage reverse transcriptase n=1 Tax=Aeromonas veronii TaxID=654 RepID=UPI003BA0CFC6